MGTDIHFYVERRENGRWVSADTWTLETECLEEGEQPYLSVGYKDHFYSNRNYDVFAILADVRNGRGFAGVDTGDGFEIIAEPRGLPHDMSPELAAEAGRFLDHTPSWVTVAELMAYDWTRTTKHRGMVNGPQFHAWDMWPRRNGEAPREYCGDVAGASIKHVSVEQMERLIEALPGKGWEKKKPAEEELSDTYCKVEWTTPYYRAARDFLSECLPRLWRLGKPEDVRCVFWFDS